MRSLLLLIISTFILISSCEKPKKSVDKATEKSPFVGPILELDEVEKGDSGTSKGSEFLADLGDRYFESGRFKEAIEVYERVLRINPTDVDTYNDLGLALHYIGKTDTAIETLKKGTKINPSYQRIWLSLGFVLTSAGRNGEAKEALKKAINLNPHSDVGIEAKRILELLK